MDLLKRSLVVVGLCCVLSIALLPLAIAQVRVNIRVGPPRRTRIAAAPSSHDSRDIHLHDSEHRRRHILLHGTWYRLNEGRWFSGRSYNGPWLYVPDPRGPRALIGPRRTASNPAGLAQDTVR